MTITIRETSKYDMFELLDFNRDVTKTSALEKSMNEYGWLDPYPMHVVKNGNGKLKIKGGHHRFHVARKLGLPIKYVIAEDKGETVHELEIATNTWSIHDYVKSFARIGKPDYMELLAAHEDTGIPINACASMLADESALSHNQGKKIKTGVFTIGDRTHFRNVSRIVSSCAMMGIPFARKTNFVHAVSAVCRVPDFSIQLFLSRVEKNIAMMTNRPNKESFLDLVDQVYNYNTKTTRIPLAFLAREAAANRNPNNRWKVKR